MTVQLGYTRLSKSALNGNIRFGILNGGRVVFNIKANDCRLISLVQYEDGVSSAGIQ